MSEEKKKTLQHEAEHAKPGKKVSVLVYLVILFGAAFVLLLMSYLMQQRMNEDALSSIKESVSAVQSLENLMAERDALTTQVQELEAELTQAKVAVEEEKKATAAASEAQSKQEKELVAMDWLREIQALYETQYYRAARAMITSFEETGLHTALPTQALYQYGEEPVLSPAESYQAMREALFPAA